MESKSAGQTPKAPRIPAGLKRRGRAFYKHATDNFDLDVDDRELLLELCRALDLLESLDTVVERDGHTIHGSMGQVVMHPALAEIRQTRIVVARLLSQLALPGEDGETMATPWQTRAKAAVARREARAGRAGVTQLAPRRGAAGHGR